MAEVVDDEWENDRLALVRNKVLHGHIGGVNSCSFFHTDSQLVVSAGDDQTVRLWHTNNSSQKEILSGHKDEVSCCRCSPDDRNIISSGLDKLMIVWDVTTQQPILQSVHDGMVMSCDVSYDGKYILTATDLDNGVYIWDMRQKKAVTIMQHHTNTVLAVRFAHNSYRFCSTSMDKKSVILDMLDYKDNLSPHRVLGLQGHTSMVSACDFSYDERRVCTGSWDTTLALWDVNAGTYRNDGPCVLAKGHHGCISACSFTKSGSVILSSSYEGNMLLWDVENGCKKLALHGHSGWVTDCQFSDDENRIISSSKDGTLRYWNVENYEWLPVVLMNQDQSLRIVQCQDCGKQYNLQKSLYNDRFRVPESVRRCVFCRHTKEAMDTKEIESSME